MKGCLDADTATLDSELERARLCLQARLTLSMFCSPRAWALAMMHVATAEHACWHVSASAVAPWWPGSDMAVHVSKLEQGHLSPASTSNLPRMSMGICSKACGAVFLWIT